MNTLPTLEQIRIMNTRPTPETDKFFATFTDGEYAPSHAEYYARLQDLERERDEARVQLAEIEDKMRIELGGHPNSKLWGEAGLIAATMRCVDALGEITAQRDRLAEAIQDAIDCRMIPITSAKEGGAAKYSIQVRTADKLREALQSLNTNQPISNQ